MATGKKTRNELLDENEELWRRLEDAEETLRAIRSGEVDALVVSGPEGEQIFTLQGAEMTYRVLVESMSEGAASLAADGTILYCNSRLAAMLQLPLERVIGTRLASFVIPADRTVYADRLERCAEECDRVEISLIPANGGPLPALFSCCAMEYPGGIGIGVVLTDIRAQKEAKEELKELNAMLEQRVAERTAELRESEERLQQALRVSRSFTFEWQPATDLVLRSDSSAAILNLAGEAVCHDTGRNYFQRVHPDDRERFVRMLQDLTPANNTYATDYRVLHNDGNGVILEEIAQATFDAAGKLVRLVGVATDITERKHYEDELKKEKTILKSIMDCARNSHLVYLDCDFNFVAVNETYAATCGYKPEEMIGRNHFDLYPNAENEALFAKVRDTGQPIEFHDKPFIFPDQLERGTTYWDWTLTPVKDKKNKVTGLVFSLFETTERKQAAEALCKSEEGLRLAQQAARVGTFEWDIQTGVNTWTPELEALYGLAPGDFGRTQLAWEQLVHPEDRANAVRLVEQSFQTGETTTGEWRVIWPDGSVHWLTGRWQVFRDDSGKPSRMTGVNLDITERKRTEAALGESERLYRAIGESIDYGIWVCDTQGRNIYTSESLLKLVGITQDQCKDFGWGSVLHPDDAEATIAAWKQCIQTGGPWYREHRYLGADGQYHPILACGVPVRDERGQITHWAGINLDISRLKQTEKALRASEERLALAASGTRIGMFEWNIATGKTLWTEQHARLLGLSTTTTTTLSEERSYREWADHIHPEDLPRVEAEIRRCMHENIPYETEYRVIWPDGSLHWLVARGVIVRGADAEPARMLGILMDITERKAAEEALNKAYTEMEEQVRERTRELREKDQILIMQSRQAAMGEMLGNIAHQWRQPLNSMGIIMQTLTLMHDAGELNRETLVAMEKQVMELIFHMSRTVDDFRNFFRPDKEKTTFHVREAVERAVALVEASFKERSIDTEVRIEDDPVITGFQNEYSQALLNILQNARDALEPRQVGGPKVTITIRVEKGKSVVRITDNAGGIPADIIHKIFDPYFTTKGPDKGTGVGLFMSRAIIEKNMGGGLTVRNTGDGAEFRIEV